MLGRKSSGDIACDDATDSAGWFPQRCNARLQVPNPVPTAPPHRTTCVCPFDCLRMDANAPLSFLTVPELHPSGLTSRSSTSSSIQRVSGTQFFYMRNWFTCPWRDDVDNSRRISSKPGVLLMPLSLLKPLPIAPTCALGESFVHPRPYASFFCGASPHWRWLDANSLSWTHSSQRPSLYIFLLMRRPLVLRRSNIWGNNKNNFQPRARRTCSFASANATRKRNGFHHHSLRKMFSTSTLSILRNASRMWGDWLAPLASPTGLFQPEQGPPHH